MPSPLEEEVLQRITPSAEEEAHLKEALGALQAAVVKRAQELRVTMEPLVVGSVAKGTHLKDPDVDLFIAFSPEVPRADLERDGLRFGDLLEGPTRMYAEHPYTRGRFMGFDVEIVPCYRLETAAERMSAVDRTPFHTRYALERIDEESRRGVRLLKAFAKGTGVYGAEARVQGFSGYLCELLILKYGGFRQTLEAAIDWRPGVKVELDVHAGRAFPEPLVVVDPVDPGRNVASAVSQRQFAHFIHAAAQYLRGPRVEFFFPRKPKALSKAHLEVLLRRRGTDVLAFLTHAPRITEDVLFPQLRKAQGAFGDALLRAGFQILDSEAYLQDEHFILLFEFVVYRLPRVRRHRGPPPWLGNAEDFITKWRTSESLIAGPLMDGDHLAVDISRTHVDAVSFLRAELPRLSLGRHIREAVAKGFQLLHNREAINPLTRGPLTEFLDRRFPWER